MSAPSLWHCGQPFGWLSGPGPVWSVCLQQFQLCSGICWFPHLARAGAFTCPRPYGKQRHCHRRTASFPQLLSVSGSKQCLQLSLTGTLARVSSEFLMLQVLLPPPPAKIQTGQVEKVSWPLMHLCHLCIATKKAEQNPPRKAGIWVCHSCHNSVDFASSPIPTFGGHSRLPHTFYASHSASRNQRDDSILW